MYRDWNGTTIGVLHQVVAAPNPIDLETGAFQRSNDLVTTNNWHWRHQSSLAEASGHAQFQRHLGGRLDVLEKQQQPLPEVRQSRFWAITVANRTDAGTEHGVSTPHTIFILFQHVRNMHYAAHCPTIPPAWGYGCRDIDPSVLLQSMGSVIATRGRSAGVFVGTRLPYAPWR